MGLFLDDNGLRYLWQKIKNMFVAKESGKGLSTNDFTAAYKSKLDGIANNANNYSLPTASATTLGGIKVGSGLSIDNGVLSATGSELNIETISIDFGDVESSWSNNKLTVKFPFNIKLIFLSYSVSENEFGSPRSVTGFFTPGDRFNFPYISTNGYFQSGTCTVASDGSDMVFNFGRNSPESEVFNATIFG